MSIPYFMCRNIEQMTTLVQKKTPEHQHNNIYHYALIKIIVVHQMGLQGIAWEEFISRDFFTAPQPPPEIIHGAGEPSHQFEGLEIEPISVPVCVTYQRGTRALFAAARRVLSPLGVEGVSPLTLAHVQGQEKGKRPMQEGGPSGGQDTDFTLID